MTKWARFLALNLLALCGLLLLVVGHVGGAIGSILGLIFVLILPGFVTAHALIGDRLQLVERLALSIALSVALIIVGGVLLNLLPGGLRAAWWALFIGMVIVGGSAALIRQWRRRDGACFEAIRIPKPRWRDVALSLAATLILVAGVGIALHSAQNRSDGGFTQLWILPGATGAQRNLVELGVRSDELSFQSFRLIVQVNGTVEHAYQISLRPGQQWQQTLALTTPHLSGPVTVEATLYRPGVSAQPYRQVHLTLMPTGSPSTSKP